MSLSDLDEAAVAHASAARCEPDPVDAADLEMLRQRLGNARFRQRMILQVRHAAGTTHQQAGLVQLARHIDVDRLVARIIKLSGCYGWGYRNFQDIRVERNVFRHSRLPAGLRGLRILQLSDLHLDLEPALTGLIRERLAGLDYDLAVITGDFRNKTDSDHGPSIQEALELLPALRPPVYAILGNHDFLELVPPLERAGVQFLLNEVVEVARGGDTLHLAGVDDPYFYRTHDLAGVRECIPEQAFTLLLCHSPETYREAAAHGFDLMLSGHTHGGQICLPGGVAMVRVAKVPTAFLKGAWDYHGTLGYTSRGTGSCGVPLRFFCPPEITLHVLERG